MGAWMLCIDFGSVFTVAATVAEDIELVRFGGEAWMPSVVALDETTGRLIAGFEAERLATRAPEWAERMPKARIAADRLQLGHGDVAVSDAVAAVLRHAADAARAAHAEEPPFQVRLTHPIAWGAERRRRLADAASGAGIAAPDLLPAPVAAAHAFGDQLARGAVVVVYYLGALTFEACVLKRTSSSFELAGAPRTLVLGGEDVDDRLHRYLSEQLDEHERRRLIASPPEQYAFRRSVRAAKEALSAGTHAAIRGPWRAAVAGELTLSRGELERVAGPALDRTVDELEGAIRDAGVAPRELAGIYLAGGSTQLPGIHRRIAARLGVEPTSHGDAATVAALGAVASREPAWRPVPTREVPTRQVALGPMASRQEASAVGGSAGVGDEPAEVVVDEDVQFTVYRPQTVQPSRWYTLLAFAHKSEPFLDDTGASVDPVAEVSRQASARLGQAFGEFGHTSQDAAQAVPRAAGLTFVPEVDGVEFNPPSRALRWLEPVHCEAFRMRAEPRLDGKRARGRLAVYLGSVLIAEVNLSFHVSSAYVPPTLGREEARPYRKIFMSYSHRDVAVVEQVEKFLSIYGDDFIRDAHNLRAGEVWEERLAQMIREADVFQLFWSRNSMVSPYVRQEWTYALSLGRPNFVRPTFWERPMPELPDQDLPPEALRRLHFRPLPIELVQSAASELTRGAARIPVTAAPVGAAVSAGRPAVGTVAAADSTSAPGPRARHRRLGANPAMIAVLLAAAIATPIAIGVGTTGGGSHGSTALSATNGSSSRAAGSGTSSAASGGTSSAAGTGTSSAAGSGTSSGAAGGAENSGNATSQGAGNTGAGGATSSATTPAPATATATATAPTAATAPATATVPSGAVAYCGANIYVGATTSCALAGAVQAAYGQHGGAAQVTLTDANGMPYTVTCSGDAPVTCTGAGGTTVYFYP